MNWQAVGQRIKTARRARGLTQDGLADRLELSTQYISVLERGVKPPSLETLVLIANELAVSADELLQDVVDRSVTANAGVLSERLSDQPPEVQRRIMKVVEAILEK